MSDVVGSSVSFGAEDCVASSGNGGGGSKELLDGLLECVSGDDGGTECGVGGDNCTGEAGWVVGDSGRSCCCCP